MCSPSKLCPYCAERECDSEDHIFLSALGGRQTIPACRTCNSLFGRTFEGKAINELLYPLLMQLAGVGVPVMNPAAKWRQAATATDGQVYDAAINKGAFELESARPFVWRDGDNPKLLHIRVGDDRIGHKFLKQFSDKDKFQMRSIERVRTEIADARLNWSFTPAIKLTAMKMAFAIAVVAFSEELHMLAKPREELTAAQLEISPKCVEDDHRDHLTLDALRHPLSHVIYVEQVDRRIQGFVQLFGALQFWIELTSSASRSCKRAFYSTLDPVSKIEDFREVEPLMLAPFPWQAGAIIDPLLAVKKLHAGAASRGAKTDQMLSVDSLKVNGVEMIRRTLWSTSWTGDVPKRNF